MDANPRRFAAAVLAAAAALTLFLTSQASAQVSFGKSLLAGAQSALPTSLQWGPDGRLYVADQQGTIRAYSIARNGPNAYAVTATETIPQLAQIPNHNDDGSAAPSATGRLVTGILVTGTAATPVIYAVSADPRITANFNDNVDTNSGILTRLTRSGGAWQRTDLVRGLPRSEENHTSNGLTLSADGTTLFIAQGGLTNKGAPSSEFSFKPEYALSAAILSVDLPAVQGGYDIPTLAHTALPWGGQSGANQARLVSGGPVQVYMPGFRNPYDIVRTQAGHLFAVDNGANAGWGDFPAAGCSATTPQANGASERDSLHLVTAGAYGGHPNPTRGNTANFPGAVPSADPRQCTYLSPGDVNGTGRANGALVTFGSSTDGLTEYTASNFGGALKGDLLAGSFDNSIQRIDLDAAGTGALGKSSLVSNVTAGGQPLDVTAVGDGGVFPGTVWWADVYTSTIGVLEPADYAGTNFVCDLTKADADGDGYTNADENANGTDPCSAADTPPDFDHDKISDKLDPDDDNDGIPDPRDVFARDKANGLATKLPVNYTWENDQPDVGGILGLGFTGLMANGVTDYLSQFDPEKMTAKGAAGVMTVDQVDQGDAIQGDQKYAFQFGVDAWPTVGAFTAHTTIAAPFAGQAPSGSQSMGMFLGTGDMNNYVKVVASAQSGGSVQVLSEVNGTITTNARVPLHFPGPNALELGLQTDPAASTVQAVFTADGGPLTAVGPRVAVPQSWFTDCGRGLAVGVISTSSGATPFPATWDGIAVTPDSGTAGATPARACSAGGPGGTDTTKPAMTKLTLSPKRFRALKRGATLLGAKSKAGTRVRFVLSEDAKVRFSVQKARSGRRSASRCVARTRRNRRAKACTRYVALKGSVTRSYTKGTRAVRFSGRIGGRRLASGRYRLVLRATDAAGNAATRRISFTIKNR